METLDYIESAMKKYLAPVDAQNNASPWTLQLSPVSGRGIFATADLPAGATLLTDAPLLLGPRAAVTCVPSCVACYTIDAGLAGCSRGCGLPVCSTRCEHSRQHQRECRTILGWIQRAKRDRFVQWSHELLRALTVVRALSLSPAELTVLKLLQGNIGAQHGFELELIKGLNLVPTPDEEQILFTTCCVLDTNAFETVHKDASSQVSLRGLYPVSALLNHSCTPNTTPNFTHDHKMVIRTTKFIPAGTELTTTYTQLLWGTAARRHFLHKTKHFWCNCLRCSDQREFGACLSALHCYEPNCGGYILPKEPLNIQSVWECVKCRTVMAVKKIGMIQTTLGSLIRTFYAKDPEEVIEFLQDRLPNVIPVCNHLAVELKFRIAWTVGYRKGYFWNELSDETLRFKERITRELLDLVERLDLGECKMRGLLKQDLHFCLTERDRRSLPLDDCSNGLENLSLESKMARNESFRILGKDLNVMLFEEIKEYRRK